MSFLNSEKGLGIRVVWGVGGMAEVATSCLRHGCWYECVNGDYMCFLYREGIPCFGDIPFLKTGEPPESWESPSVIFFYLLVTLLFDLFYFLLYLSVIYL